MAGNGPATVRSTTPSQPNQFLSIGDFLQMTQDNVVPVQQNLAYVDGNTSTINLPQSGLANRMYLMISGKIVVAGTITGGTWQGWPNPAPFSLAKLIKFGSNVNVNIRNITGISMYNYTRMRYGMDPFSHNNQALFSGQNASSLGLTNGSRIIPNANVQAGTYYFNWMIPIDVAYNFTGERCLLNLQSNNVIWQLAITWGLISGGIGAAGGTNDFFNALTGSGITVTPTITASLSYEYFENVMGNTSALESQYLSVIDQNPAQTLVNGQNLYTPPTTELYTMLFLQVYNNGYQADNTNQFSNFFLRYAANQSPYQCDMLTWAMRQFYMTRVVPPDGLFGFDFGLRRGEITRRDTYDAFSNANITDLKIGWTVPSTYTLTGNQGAIAVLESLQSAG